MTPYEYALTNLFAFIAVILGVVSYRRDGVLPGKDFSDTVPRQKYVY